MNRFFQGRRYERDGPRLSGWDVVLWWESRRWYYNLIVGATGLITCVLLISCALVAEPLVGEAIGMPDPPIFGPIIIILYGFMANICYTGGWIIELVLARVKLGGDTTAFGVTAFRRGMKFSIGLTLLPGVLTWAIFLIRLAIGKRGEPL